MPLRRLGTLGDGGYVVWVWDDDRGKCPCDLYISAGVGTEESFTWDFLTLAGLPPPFEAWAFDGTVAAFPPQYIPKGWRVYFVRRNIDPEMTAYTANLHRLIAAHSNIFLKMDIEGSEYAWLAGLTDEQMGRFCQIVVEFHDINGAGGGGTKELFTAVWEKVQRTHWVAHIHGNNYGGTGDDGRPNVIEVTFVRQDVRAGMFVAEKDIVIAPIAGLDWPNRCGWPDIAWQPLRSLSKARQLTSDDV